MSVDLPSAKIFSRDQHPISRKDIDREALKVMYRLRDAGYSAYLVGGGVRDLYLGKSPKDFDISTNARPGQLRKLFRNSRIIGRRFRLVQVFFHGNKIIEVSTLRCLSEFDIDGPDHVLPANNTFGSLGEDASRRDLTINSLFYEIENFTVIDYVGGVEDLLAGIIRLVGEPARRITRDPARMLRVIRHAARNNFTIEENTWKAITAHPEYLKLCPDSRIRDELLKDLKGGASAAWVELAIDSGIFQVLLPVYEKIMDQGIREQLARYFAVSDRLNAAGIQLPEPFLFTLLLLPWAQKEFGIPDSLLKKGPGGGVVSKLRKRVDESLHHLNVKRHARDTITGLLVNLPVFIQHAGKDVWPKWLTRKSYFKDGLLFSQVYFEATGGEQVSIQQIEISEPVAKPRKQTARRRKSSAKGNRKPAFAAARGGIFGLRKK
ncbi:MAG: poly(A) polymerase [Thermodesulfobacteriota bacterium]